MQQNSFPTNDFFGEFYRKQLHRMKNFHRIQPKNKSSQRFSSNTNSNRGLAPEIIFISPDASTRHYNLPLCRRMCRDFTVNPSTKGDKTMSIFNIIQNKNHSLDCLSK